MPKSGKHLTLESREIVEQGIRDGDPASKIARRLRVAASTVTREARAHRTVRPKKMSPHERASNRCARRPSCSKSGEVCQDFGHASPALLSISYAAARSAAALAGAAGFGAVLA